MSKTQPPDSGATPLRKRRHLGRWLLLLVLLAYAACVFVFPLPAIQSSSRSLTALKAESANLVWPAFGQSAVGAPGYGVLSSHGDSQPVPTASIAKVLTALAVLKQYPLLKDQTGPTITVSADDVSTYQKYIAANGSVVQVQNGEQLTEYQALEAMLLPSANNIADLLASWAFGSTANYVRFANSFAKTLGLSQTTVADANGFSPQTTSTAHDLVLLGENVMDNPTLAEIVAEPQATIPVAGIIYNVNLLVGHQEVVGIKTGNTDQAGGCFLVAARHNIDANHQIVVIAAVLGAPDLATAIQKTVPLLDSVYQSFALATVIPSGTVVGSYKPAWSSTATATVSQDITGIIWKPAPPIGKVDLPPLKLTGNHVDILPAQASATFGRQTVSVPVTVTTIPPAPWSWRFVQPIHRL